MMNVKKLFFKIIEGIALEVSEDDPPFEEAIKMNIKYISVLINCI